MTRRFLFGLLGAAAAIKRTIATRTVRNVVVPVPEIPCGPKFMTTVFDDEMFFALMRMEQRAARNAAHRCLPAEYEP